MDSNNYITMTIMSVVFMSSLAGSSNQSSPKTAPSPRFVCLTPHIGLATLFAGITGWKTWSVYTKYKQVKDEIATKTNNAPQILTRTTAIIEALKTVKKERQKTRDALGKKGVYRGLMLPKPTIDAAFDKNGGGRALYAAYTNLQEKTGASISVIYNSINNLKVLYEKGSFDNQIVAAIKKNDQELNAIVNSAKKEISKEYRENDPLLNKAAIAKQQMKNQLYFWGGVTAAAATVTAWLGWKNFKK